MKTFAPILQIIDNFFDALKKAQPQQGFGCGRLLVQALMKDGSDVFYRVNQPDVDAMQRTTRASLP
jgi:hypothetical protein